MLEGGVRRRVVQDFMDLLGSSVVPKSRRPLDVLWTRVVLDKAIVALEIGDSLNVRLVFQGASSKMNSELPRTWIQPPTGATVENYDPLLIVRINLTKIRNHFK
jgi:hypothetical protein